MKKKITWSKTTSRITIAIEKVSQKESCLFCVKEILVLWQSTRGIHYELYFEKQTMLSLPTGEINEKISQF